MILLGVADVCDIRDKFYSRGSDRTWGWSPVYFEPFVVGESETVRQYDPARNAQSNNARAPPTEGEVVWEAQLGSC